jgi:hypothetical protein
VNVEEHRISQNSHRPDYREMMPIRGIGRPC